MSIENQDTRIKVSGDGATLTFSFNFKIYSDADISVLKQVKTTLVEDAMVLGVDYSVTINTVSEGGTITFVIGSVPLSTEWVFMFSDLDYTQPVSIPIDGTLREESLENGMDRITRLAQQNKAANDLSIKLNATDETTAPTFPSFESGKFIGWDTVDNLENKDDPTTAAAASAAAALVSENNAAASAALADADAISTAADVVSTNADVVSTNADVVLTHADVLLTNADVVTTNADVVLADAAAASAAASAASGLYETVTAIAFGDSPLAPVAGDDGTLWNVDTSGGNVVVNLDTLANYANDMKLAFCKVSADANTITINRGGTDTISGATSLVLGTQYAVNVIIGDSATGIWINSIQSTALTDGSVTMAKLADIATMKVIGRTDGGTGVPSAVSILDEDAMGSDSAVSVATQQSIKAYVDNNLTPLLDEDDMASDSATSAASQQSIKTYVDNQIDASAVAKDVTQAIHGLLVGDWIRLDGATTYVKATADSAANAEVIGVIVAVADVNTFTVQTGGFASIFTGLTANSTYFLDPTTAGAITLTEPSSASQVSKPVLITESTTGGYVLQMRGTVIEAESISIQGSAVSSFGGVLSGSMSTPWADAYAFASDFDTGGDIGSTCIFTAPVAGIYKFSAMVMGNLSGMWITRAAGNRTIGAITGTGTADSNLECFIDLAVGDTVKITGASGAGAGSYSYFSGSLIA